MKIYFWKIYDNSAAIAGRHVRYRLSNFSLVKAATLFSTDKSRSSLVLLNDEQNWRQDLRKIYYRLNLIFGNVHDMNNLYSTLKFYVQFPCQRCE